MIQQRKYITFEEYKQRISIMQVAMELGYVCDPKQGRTRPTFELKDANGNTIDKIVISNPHNNSTMGYFRHNPRNGRDSGDLISFVRENLRSFPETSAARNEVDAINRVLARLSNTQISPAQIIQNAFSTSPDNPMATAVFDLNRWQRSGGDTTHLTKLFAERAIPEDVVNMFSRSIDTVVDAQNEKKFKNIGFPYTPAGTIYRADEPENIVGYEIRGYGKFRQKAAGTDSTNGCWQAYLGKYEAPMIEHIHIAESAYDIMAYVALNKQKLAKDLDSSLFVSFGGSFSPNQMIGLIKGFPSADLHLHFDNDLTGVLYDCRTAAIICDKTWQLSRTGDEARFTIGERAFTLPLDTLSYDKFRQASGLRPSTHILIDKANGKYKDWNDQLKEQSQNAYVGRQKFEAPKQAKISIKPDLPADASPSEVQAAKERIEQALDEEILPPRGMKL